MQKNSPGKTFIPSPLTNTYICNDYPYIKLNTLEKPYLYLKQELPKITIEENLHLAVKKIDKINYCNYIQLKHILLYNIK